MINSVHSKLEKRDKQLQDHKRVHCPCPDSRLVDWTQDRWTGQKSRPSAAEANVAPRRQMKGFEGTFGEFSFLSCSRNRMKRRAVPNCPQMSPII